MPKRRWLPARLIAVGLVLLGAAAMNAAAAKDHEPPANHTDAGNTPDKAPPPADNQTGGGKPAPWQDGAPSATQADNGWGPIDTSITVQGPPKSRHGFKTFDRKKAKIAARPSENSAGHHRPWTRGARVGVVRNTIGLPVHQVSTGNKAGPSQKGFEKPTVEGTPKSADVAGSGSAGAAGPDPHHRGFVPLASGGTGGTGGGSPHDPRINTAINHAAIDGRDWVRPGSGSVVGGANKIAAGVIDGTNFHPRHP